jgi:hypothetical protein
MPEPTTGVVAAGFCREKERIVEQFLLQDHKLLEYLSTHLCDTDHRVFLVTLCPPVSTFVFLSVLGNLVLSLFLFLLKLLSHLLFLAVPVINQPLVCGEQGVDHILY